MKSPYASAVSDLPSMHISTYEQFVIQHVVDHKFWNTLRKNIDGVVGVSYFSTLNIIGETLHQLNEYREQVFHRKMIKTLSMHGGLQDINPLEFTLLQFAAGHQRAWTTVTRSATSSDMLIPAVLQAVHKEQLDAVYATRILLELFYKATRENVKIVCDKDTLPFLIETQDDVLEWVFAGVTWESSGLFKWAYSKYIPYLEYV